MFRTPFAIDPNTQMPKFHCNLNHQKFPSPQDLESNSNLKCYTLKTIPISEHKFTLPLPSKVAHKSWPKGVYVWFGTQIPWISYLSVTRILKNG